MFQSSSKKTTWKHMTKREISLCLVFTLATSFIITDLYENWCRNSINSAVFDTCFLFCFVKMIKLQKIKCQCWIKKKKGIEKTGYWTLAPSSCDCLFTAVVLFKILAEKLVKRVKDADLNNGAHNFSPFFVSSYCWRYLSLKIV